jgi:hypothetical protein
MKYIEIKGVNGVYIFTKEEIDRALDRENEGVVWEIIEEKDYK